MRNHWRPVTFSLQKTLFCFTFLFSLIAFSGSAYGQTNSPFEVVRINNSQPIIDQDMFDDLGVEDEGENINGPSLIRIPCLLYTSPSPRDATLSRMPSSA